MAMQSSVENPVPLREVASAVKGWVDRLGMIWVSAQVIELSRKTGVTHYLTLRDPTQEVSVSVTLSTAVLDAAGPVNTGMAVTAQLKPTVWLKSGRLSYECFSLRPTGEGQLLAQIEHLKRLLQAEGLFNPALKRTLPYLPKGIGLITGKDTAAEKDVVVNVERRWPAARILTRHCLMQGPSSAAQILTAVADFDKDPSIDVIVIARGGGSVEDLLPFSDEALVRAVANARTPVVSAIGHEVDTPILDLVADLRASTPTDAAKRIVPDAGEELERVRRMREHLRSSVNALLINQATNLEQWRLRPVLRDPLSRFDVYTQQIETLRNHLRQATSLHLDREESSISRYTALVGSLGPQSVLARGYSILIDSDGHNISTTESAVIGSEITAHLSDGRITVKVTNKDLSGSTADESNGAESTGSRTKSSTNTPYKENHE
ncbi:MAG: exodeoxyribonuclease VII large subunit [Propionibacteriaceae bacterium]|jgi:exodeoxyribonuclease VII large subunit|nr:exodeoxyribonuclease VII large subunit [Propionibacteriaceae bacterium]